MANTLFMRLIKDHNGICQNMLKIAFETSNKALCLMADCVGVVVAEIRMTLVPGVQKIIAGPPTSSNVRRRKRKTKSGRSVRRGVNERTVVVKLPTTSKLAGKKYTYEWAISRLQELEDIGVSDPVGYFNNEMADWWLAPEGMMEKEADFVGIARAIEERWHR